MSSFTKCIFAEQLLQSQKNLAGASFGATNGTVIQTNIAPAKKGYPHYSIPQKHTLWVHNICFDGEIRTDRLFMVEKNPPYLELWTKFG